MNKLYSVSEIENAITHHKRIIANMGSKGDYGS